VLTGDVGYGRFAGRVFLARLRTPAGAPIPITWDSVDLGVHPDCDNPNGH
jgi:hypothetical protein